MVLRISEVALVMLLTCAPWLTYAQSQHQLLVGMTMVKNTTAKVLGAYCLDGSLPGYHFHKDSVLVQAIGFCNLRDRATTRRGSTRYMTKVENFSGILSNNESLNPEFYNWNRVKLRYCDGASFAGDSKYDDGTSLLYFRGQKIWQAMIHDLLPKGLANAEKALLSGCSAGGLAVFLHCDNLSKYLPKDATVKCLSDAGFFLDAKDIANRDTIRSVFGDVVTLQGVEQNLDPKCTSSLVDDPKLCFFPQHALSYIKNPVFVLNTAYDVWQFHNILVPSSADRRQQEWKYCKYDITTCTDSQIDTLQDYRQEMLKALYPFYKHSTSGGMFINSCFAHCQSESQGTWLDVDSPRVRKQTIAEAVGDWYFERKESKLVDCAYPCNPSCKNIIPA